MQIKQVKQSLRTQLRLRLQIQTNSSITTKLVSHHLITRSHLHHLVHLPSTPPIYLLITPSLKKRWPLLKMILPTSVTLSLLSCLHVIKPYWKWVKRYRNWKGKLYFCGIRSITHSAIKNFWNVVFLILNSARKQNWSVRAGNLKKKKRPSTTTNILIHLVLTRLIVIFLQILTVTKKWPICKL